MESEQMIPAVLLCEEAAYIIKNGGKASVNSMHLVTHGGSNQSKDYTYYKKEQDITCIENRRNSEINHRKRKVICRTCNIVWGVILVTLSILGFVYPIRDLVLWDKLNMRPGFPPFDWWSKPPSSTKVKTYIFNVTNHERFLSGLDDKINVQEIGPIAYREQVVFSNITFTEDETLSYKSYRNITFCPADSVLDRHATVILPNSALLGISSMLHGSSNYFRRVGFKFIMALYGNNFFVKKTVHEVLWDYKDAIMEATKSFSPQNVNSTNMGFLNRTYDLMTNDVKVKIGPRWGHENFFKIQEYKDVPELSGYDMDICLDSVVNTTEGILFPQYLKKEDVPLFFSKSICRILPLAFDEERINYGMTVYRYNFSKTAFDNKKDVPEYCRKDDLSLPSGLKDGSKCYSDFPMVLSAPHFNKADIPKDKYVTGLKPDPVEHTLGYYEIEPITGTPIKLSVKLQCNLWIHDITDLYSLKFNKFSNLVLPLVWFEFSQETLPPYIMNFIYFTVIVLPILSKITSPILLICGFYLIVKRKDQNKFKIGTSQIFRSLKK